MATEASRPRLAKLPTPTGTEELGPRPLHMLSVVEMVVEELRRAIVTGSLAAGAPIQISDLATALGVSHIPVREALRRLEGDGLVELSRGRAGRVAPLSAGDLDDVFHHLQLLEVDAIGRATGHFSDDHERVVRRAWAALRVGPGDDSRSLSVRHAQLHQLLVAPACSAWDWRILAMTWLAAARYMFLTLEDSIRRGPTAFYEAHGELVEAVCDGTSAGAMAAARSHLADDAAQAHAALEAAGVVSPTRHR
jgi:DNA-binding GntR family transcriptional regulator